MSYCGSEAPEEQFLFLSAHSNRKFLSLRAVCLRPTASSATLWGTSSSARCWRGLASAAICPNCTLSSRCQAPTWERCTTTARWSAQVRTDTIINCKCAASKTCNYPQRHPGLLIIIITITTSFICCRSVADAEAEKIRVPAAAHLQRSRRSTENIPLSPESETRYWLKAARGKKKEEGKIETETEQWLPDLKDHYLKATLFKYSWKCCHLFLFLFNFCTCQLANTQTPASELRAACERPPHCVSGTKQSFVTQAWRR